MEDVFRSRGSVYLHGLAYLARQTYERARGGPAEFTEAIGKTGKRGEERWQQEG
jgi:hypothetical protein